MFIFSFGEKLRGPFISPPAMLPPLPSLLFIQRNFESNCWKNISRGEEGRYEIHCSETTLTRNGNCPLARRGEKRSWTRLLFERNSSWKDSNSRERIVENFRNYSNYTRFSTILPCILRAILDNASSSFSSSFNSKQLVEKKLQHTLIVITIVMQTLTA